MKNLLNEIIAAMVEIRDNPEKLALLEEGYKEWAEGFEEDEGFEPDTLGEKLEGLCNAVDFMEKKEYDRELDKEQG